MLHHRVPAPLLAEHIDALWIFAPDSPPPAHAHERILPGGTAQIIVALDDRSLSAFDPADRKGWLGFRGAVLSGPRWRHHLIESPGRSPLAGIHFRPGGLRPFIAVPASRYENRHVPLAEAWGPAAGAWRRRLLAAKTVDQRFAMLVAGLVERLSGIAAPAAIADALRRFAAGPAEHRIATAVARSGMSARRFIASFREHVGLTPKRYCRVLRFQRALRGLAEARRAKIDLALGCGYCDQAHFNRDFRAFTGLTPRDYRALVGEHRSHVRS